MLVISIKMNIVNKKLPMFIIFVVFFFQVTEVGDFLSKGDNLKSVCMRNAGIDDAMFESIADSLRATKSNPLVSSSRQICNLFDIDI